MREDAGITLKPISVAGTRRIVRFAFEYARANGRRKVSLGHKSNVMRYSDGLFLKTFLDIARDPMIRGDVEVEEIQIDHLSMRLAWEPEAFDVLLLPNLYGDILSDLCAGLVGGLGLIPGANIGWEYAVFEPVHGSAPDIAGKGLANPIAMILSGAMMLRHLREPAAAERVELAVDEVLGEGRSGRPTSAGRRARRRSGARSPRRCPPSRSRRVVVVVSLRTSTEVLGEPSTAGLAVMPAALPDGERRLQPVAERQAELRQERGVVHAPVREEVPSVLPRDRPESVIPHRTHATAAALRRCASTRTQGMGDSIPMLAVVKPSPLRLWGFLLTVLGGALVAFGSIGSWAAISLGNSVENAVPTKGIDVWQGTASLILGVVIVVGILALRFVRPERRNAMAVAIVVAGLAALALALWVLLALTSVMRDPGVDELAKVYGRQQVLQAMSTVGVAAKAQAGLYMTVAGGVLATVGGLVDLAWVRQKRLAGNAIDPDTLPANTEPEP